MSDKTHPLAVGNRTRMTSDSDILSASHPVTSVHVSDGPNLPGSATAQQPESLALNLNIDLDSNSLTANDNHSGASSSANGSTTNGAAAMAAANAAGVNANISTSSNRTVPTPVMESSSNSGSTKAASLTSAYSSVNSISNDSGTNAVRMFQRMDELSARFIVMEEMFQKLCKTVDEQSLSIADLKLQNSQLCQIVTSRFDELCQQLRQSGEHPNDQDSFVTDLLNSITNVSSSYLRKIRSRSRSGSNRISPMQPGISTQSTQWAQNNQQQLANTQTFPQAQSNNVPSDKTFTLNPNGIKRRRRNNDPPDSNVTSGAPSYTDLASLNNLGAINLPNLTLDHTGITPLLRSGGNMGPTSDGANGISPLGFAAHLSQDEQRQQQRKEVRQQQRQNSKSKGIHLEMHSELVSGNEEEDGYQEEDDEDDNSILAKTDSSSGGSSSSDDSSADEEVGADREIDKSSHTKRKITNLTGENIRSLIGNSNDVGISNTPDRDERLVLKNSRLAMETMPVNYRTRNPYSNSLNHANVVDRSPSSRDLNYTLLKAPSDVKTIWQEYFSGIGGDPPIKKLEEKYGNKWRLNRNRKTFARRKRLYKFILNGISKGKSADEMIDALEHRRLYTDENGQVKRRTIGWLQQSLTGI